MCLFRQILKHAWLLLCLALAVHGADTARQTIAKAATAGDETNTRELIMSLLGQGDDAVEPLLTAWRKDSLFLYTAPDGAQIPVTLIGAPDAAGTTPLQRVDDGKTLLGVDGKEVRMASADLTAVEHTSSLRRAMKLVLDLLDLSAVNPSKRLAAVQTIGLAQDPVKLVALKNRQKIETDASVLRELRVAIALIQLKDPKSEMKVAALNELRDLSSLASADFINRTIKEAELSRDQAVLKSAKLALQSVEQHRSAVDFFGTLFRGVSLGSILLVAALGLAITFGLMRVINMAHGEMIAVGAYTTYLVQNIFGAGITIPFFGFSLPIPGMNLTGAAYQWYFIAALPLSFISAAVVGILLERTVIQFLYRRPLESLLATWGVSLVLQQCFRLMFGANNVQVSSPVYLSGNWLLHDVILGWNRVFVIGFACLIVFGMWVVLSKTSLGLLIRASMQNRTMASCLGVKTERVNMLTFGLGSGLAGLAGAFLSQIGNVGPSLGQGYIIDSFMVVVVGGVGSIGGTIISAFSIGGIDQVLQQYLPDWAPGLGWVPGIGTFLQNLAQDAAVFGKILVLAGIILFLQRRPSGLFVTRSRNLDE